MFSLFLLYSFGALVLGQVYCLSTNESAERSMYLFLPLNFSCVCVLVGTCYGRWWLCIALLFSLVRLGTVMERLRIHGYMEGVGVMCSRQDIPFGIRGYF